MLRSEIVFPKQRPKGVCVGVKTTKSIVAALFDILEFVV